MAAEFVQANYDAIVAATSAGIIVVEAAGNGSEDLDQPEYDAAFRDRPDSGAIMVGAGDGCPDPYPERGRLGFSTFGARVDLHGWGNCVTTAGYGTLQGSSESDDSYTASFSGTSSASPIVAAAAAVVSSVAIEQGDVDGLSSTEARSLLVSTGTPQDTSPAALTGNIGPLPNLAAALGLMADVQVAKSADPEPAVAGEGITWTVTVTNAGPDVATDVEVLDDVPAGVTLTALPSECVVGGSGDIACDLGAMAPLASVDLEFSAEIDHDLVFDAGAPVVLTNSASSTSTVDDPNPANNAAVVDSNVLAEADLALVSVEVLDAPTEAVIGEDHQITIRSSATNLGPSWPMNAELATTATTSAGASVVPGAAADAVPALPLDTPVPVEQVFTISCEEPGQQQVDFDLTLFPANAADSDPDLTNNTAEASVTVECLVPVAINIRPGNKHNHLQPGSNGLVPVAVLTTAAGQYGLPVAFDATLIDASTVRFGDPGLVLSGVGGATLAGSEQIRDAHELDDKSKDGDDDMVMRFVSSETGLDGTDTEACVRGTYVAGGSSFTFVGCDFVQPIP